MVLLLLAQLGCSSRDAAVGDELPASTERVIAHTSEYGDRISGFPVEVLLHLAERNKPDAEGAIGRNRADYFHVRFQMGLHHLADYGIAAQDPEAIEHFVRSVEYSFRHQEEAGDFRLTIPESLGPQPVPSTADLASGTAFFGSSLGAGWYAIETSGWVKASAACKPMRDRLEKLKPQLSSMLDYLLAHDEVLAKVDSQAPNRLLFDAQAFYTLGKLLDREAAIEVASRFVSTAAKQTHEQGYFVEGGGFDSSYNGVATAVAIRLLLAGYDQHNLADLSRRAMRWQKTRILETGEISTIGNSRVAPNGDGESFLGRKKDVDAAHTVEAFILAASYFGDRQHETTAKVILQHYLEKGRSRPDASS